MSKGPHGEISEGISKRIPKGYLEKPVKIKGDKGEVFSNLQWAAGRLVYVKLVMR